MLQFNDLVFKPHPVSKSAKQAVTKLPDNLKHTMQSMANATQAIIEFPNGVKLSVICGKCFYSNGVDTYEAMVLDADNEPVGHLTVDELNKYMRELQGE